MQLFVLLQSRFHTFRLTFYIVMTRSILIFVKNVHYFLEVRYRFVTGLAAKEMLWHVRTVNTGSACTHTHRYMYLI